NGQAETFSRGRSGKRFTPRIAPLQLRLRQSFHKMNAPAKLAAGYQSMDTAGFRSANTNDHQLHIRIDTSGAQQAIEGADQEWNVLVAAVLRNAKQERLTPPARDWRNHSTHRFSLHTVVDSNRFLTRAGRHILL